MVEVEQGEKGQVEEWQGLVVARERKQEQGRGYRFWSGENLVRHGGTLAKVGLGERIDWNRK